MGQRVGVIAADHLGHGGGARGEIDQHQLVDFCLRQGGPVDGVGFRRAQGVEAPPAVALAADDDQGLERRAFVADGFDGFGVLIGHDGHLGPGPVDPVFQVLGGQQVGARHGDDAGFGAAEDHVIPSRNARQHDHGAVAFFSAQGHQRVGEAVGGAVQIGVAVAGDGFTRTVDGDQRRLVGFPRPLGDHVEGEVEIVGHRQGEVRTGGVVIERGECVAHLGASPVYQLCWNAQQSYIRGRKERCKKL